MDLDDDFEEETHLATSESLVIVVFFSANWTGSFVSTGSLKSFERFEAVFVKNVRAAENFLLLDIKLLKADWAIIFFFLTCSIEIKLLNRVPLSKA